MYHTKFLTIKKRIFFLNSFLKCVDYIIFEKIKFQIIFVKAGVRGIILRFLKKFFTQLQ